MNQQKLEPIRSPENESRVFSEPWEAQAFALTHLLFERGRFEWSRWSAALALEIERAKAAEGPSRGHYECWLSALERFLVDEEITSESQLLDMRQAWKQAARRTPHGKPIEMSPSLLRKLA
ncbi:MAG: nitrile hydratase accessory protein [Pseudomonadota bacterium]